MSKLFVVVYAGNIGPLQALEVVILAAESIQDDFPNFRLLIVGSGIDAARLKNIVTDRGISSVIFMPRQSASEINKIYHDSKAALIHLKSDPLSSMGIPQKTQAYLKAGKPIIAAVQGEVAVLVRKSNSGLICAPENQDSIKEAFVSIMKMKPQERDQMGRNGSEYYWKNLSFNAMCNKISAAFHSVIVK